jgi:hypothetical protein
VDDQVQAADVEVEELPVPAHPVDQEPLEGAERRVEGLERAERRQVDRRDRVAGQPALEVEGQRFHLGQLGHGRSVGTRTDTGDTHHGRGHTGAVDRPLPELGEIFSDARGENRALRVSWHTDRDLVVLSMWRDNVCAASFRLTVEEVPQLVELLRAGLSHAYGAVTRPA